MIQDTTHLRYESYGDQGAKAIAWYMFLLAGWLLMRLRCHLGLPSDCMVPWGGLEVLTDLAVLFAFGLVQSWMCEVVEDRRFKRLVQSWYFPVFYVGSILGISELQSGDVIPKPGVCREDFSPAQWSISVVAFSAMMLFVLYHFTAAWKTLPGVRMVSGNADLPGADGDDNLFNIFLFSRLAIVVFFWLYC